MSRLGFLLFIVLLFAILDGYAFGGLSLIFGNFSWFSTIYWATTAIVLLGFVKVFRDLRFNSGEVRSPSTNLWLGLGFAVFITKILIVGLLLIQDGGRLIIGIFSGLISLFTALDGALPDRDYWFTAISIALAGIPFLSMLYGISFGKYRFAVEDVKLRFKDLPEAFHGFKIAQISDIHSGTFDSIRQVQKGVKKLMAQRADLIVFTGDLVNSLLHMGCFPSWETTITTACIK